MMERNRKNTPWWETCVKQVALDVESSPNGLNRNEAAARWQRHDADMTRWQGAADVAKQAADQGGFELKVQDFSH